MMGYLLGYIARLAYFILEPILIIYSISKRMVYRDLSLDRYFFYVAYTFDQTANVVGQDILNDTILKSTTASKWIHTSKHVVFGNPDWTISYVIAANQRIDNLTRFGKFWAWFLDFVDKDHLKKAIEFNEE